MNAFLPDRARIGLDCVYFVLSHHFTYLAEPLFQTSFLFYALR